MKSSLSIIGEKYKTDKATYHNFTDIYDTYFKDIRNNNLKVLEIGIFNGGSLRMWKEYFPNSLIYGIDNEQHRCFFEDRITSSCGSQVDRAFLRDVFSGTNFDIIIDDGGHTMEQQQVTLDELFSRVTPGGFFVLEDLHTSLEQPQYKEHKNQNLSENIFNNTTLGLIYQIQQKNIKVYNKDYITNISQFTDKVEYCNVHVTGKDPSITSVIKKSPTL